MGIRINKTLGWGMELKPGERESLFNEDYEDKSFSGYLDYIDQQENQEFSSEKALIHGLGVDLDKISPCDVLHFFSESPEVEESTSFVIIVPVPEVDGWHRSDSIIDYYDSNRIPENSVKYIEGGEIFPWSPRAMDIRTGEPVTDEQNRTIDIIKNLAHIHDDQETLDRIISDLGGFTSYKEYTENIVPGIPDVIRNPASFLGLFKDESTITRLRPMLGTYWQ